MGSNRRPPLIVMSRDIAAWWVSGWVGRHLMLQNREIATGNCIY
jgi:hypothetical protein